MTSGYLPPDRLLRLRPLGTALALAFLLGAGAGVDARPDGGMAPTEAPGGASGEISRAAAGTAGGIIPLRAHPNPEDPPHGDGLRAQADTTDVQSVIADTTLVLRLQGDTLRVPYYSNILLEETHPEVLRAVVMIHGTLRNARDYFRTLEEAADLVPEADSTSLLVAPQFLTEADVAADTLPDDHLFWAYMGWRQGDHSLSTVEHPRPARISSFAVIDTILLRLAAQQPNLEAIVIAGHSAGGQFVNRFTAGSPLHDLLASTYGISLRYVVSNPSSYLYFDDRRWVAGSSWTFAVPPAQQIALCPNYDLYKYGLQQPNEYMDIGSALLRSRYSGRPVAYLLGNYDNDPNSAYLETNCEAMLQGEHRLQRGLIYRQHLMSAFGSGILTLHRFAVVPGVGHDQRGIFTSTCGVAELFNYGSCPANLPSNSWLDATTEVLRAVGARTVSWGDPDGDGDADLFLAAPDSADRLLRNDAGVFADATPASLQDSGNATASAWVDADGDSDPDLCVIHWRGANRLYRNDGVDFTDVAAGPLLMSADQTAARWADYDRDGDLDAYLCRVSDQPDLLLRNDGGFVFTDVTPPLFADTLSARDACWADLDNDLDSDLYVVNQDGPKRLYRNDDSTFTEITSSPINDNSPGSSACFGDYDNDGDLDVYIVNRNAPCKLLRNDLEAGWADVTASPLGDAGPNRNALWLDYDNDTDLDLYLVKFYARNRLYRNNGNGTFSDVSEYPLHDGGPGCAGAAADFDRDGDLDLYMANDTNWNKLLRNQSALGRHWLEVKLAGVISNRDGVGARVRIVVGGRVQIREIGVETGSPGQGEAIAHFGLGSATTVDSLEVYWPSGIVQAEIPGFPADRHITITESDLPAGADLGAARAPRLSGATPNPFAVRTSLVLSLRRPGVVSVCVHDVAGRNVRRLLHGMLPAGERRLDWDGRDDRGRAVPSGVYFLRVDAGGERDRARLVRLTE